MTPPVALTANTPLPTNSPASTTAQGVASSSSDSSQNFSQPLQQAQRQWARQNDPSPSTPAKPSSPKTASSQAQPQAKTKDKAGAKDDDKTPSPSPDAAAAMLALLGQSVPASAAPTAVSTDADDAVDATTGGASGVTLGALPTSPAGLSLLGAMQANTQPATAGTNTFTKAMDGIQDKSLSMLAQGADEGDDSADASTTTATQGAKGDAFTAALQTLTTSSKQDDGSDPLDALKNLAAMAAPQQPAAQASATTPAAHVLTMQSSVGTPAFGQELSQQVTWLGGQDVKEARIRLHPEDLGELDVKVSVKQDHVDVAFIAQHPQAVHAVQQTLGQLDSMLAHHGLSLGQAQVGQGNSGQGSGSSGGSASGGESGLADAAGDVASVVAPVVKAVGLVDMFA
nr:flagellar hook-length control protein FliK [Dyella sp. ASV24]